MSKLALAIKAVLDRELQALKKYGVDHLGYRYFLPDGRSFGCPTAAYWYNFTKTPEFYQSMQTYLSQELIRLYHNNFAYVNRSIEQQQNAYLDWLQKMHMDTSIGIYKFNKLRIDSLFFILNSGDNGAKRDILINNMPYLEKHTNAIAVKMDQLHNELFAKEPGEIIIPQAICRQLFQKPHNFANSNIIWNGKAVSFTKKELEILSRLKLGISNKQLAAEVKMNERNVSKYICSLRRKLGVNSKNELVYLANQPQLQPLFKYM